MKASPPKDKEMRRCWLVLLLCAVAYGTFLSSNIEPSYGGRPVSAWADDWDYVGIEARYGAFAAIRTIGAAALPYLKVGPRPRGQRLGFRFYRLVKSVVPERVYFQLPGVPDSVSISGAGGVQALKELGQAARPAIPTLLRWLDDPDYAVRADVVDALVTIAPDDEAVVRSLIAQFRREPQEGRVFDRASYTFPGYGWLDREPPKKLLPLMVLLLDSSNEYIRKHAALGVLSLANVDQHANAAAETVRTNGSAVARDALARAAAQLAQIPTELGR